ncbi:recombinase family protein [Bradyrhizobium sp. DOA1]|uniref:recombinase family protein n=1 Tax=Bradyrhizobium sp. DOA1 TaxID=1126616 RepID=UPI00077C78D3|nr:recombinase family protein [Bradyrhizobium sp. DOA1]
MAQLLGVAQQSEKRVRAAQYIRMSSEQQRYSTANQALAIAAYAIEHDLEIVQSYIDKARSGLTIKGRSALQQLLHDVKTAQADYKVILVFDVSRWGRFQDADESAYYEFICKSAGVSVQYCAEQFDNDGSFMSNIAKQLKRIGAGQYSLDLSKKVFAAQCRLVTLGFRQGGPAGYGLRRELVDRAGRSKGFLANGQRKALQEDRVLLRPGGRSAYFPIVRRRAKVPIGDRQGTERRGHFEPVWSALDELDAPLSAQERTLYRKKRL